MSTIDSLLSVCEQLGDIHDSNGHFTEGLARRIDETGKQLNDFTLSELFTLIDQYREFYNRYLSGNVVNDPVVTTNTVNPISAQESIPTPVTSYQAGQLVEALQYISLSLKTVDSDVEKFVESIKPLGKPKINLVSFKDDLFFEVQTAREAIAKTLTAIHELQRS